MRGAVALLIAGALSARVAIGGEPPADQSPAPSARLVTIDLVATDARGRTVENLTAADFDLREARAAIESFSGRRGDYEPRNAYERDYIAGTPARIDAVRNQVALYAINALALHLGALSDRRKTLIVASEGVGRADRGRGQEYLPT